MINQPTQHLGFSSVGVHSYSGKGVTICAIPHSQPTAMAQLENTEKSANKID